MSVNKIPTSVAEVAVPTQREAISAHVSLGMNSPQTGPGVYVSRFLVHLYIN